MLVQLDPAHAECKVVCRNARAYGQHYVFADQHCMCHLGRRDSERCNGLDHKRHYRIVVRIRSHDDAQRSAKDTHDNIQVFGHEARQNADQYLRHAGNDPAVCEDSQKYAGCHQGDGQIDAAGSIFLQKLSLNLHVRIVDRQRDHRAKEEDQIGGNSALDQCRDHAHCQD